MVAAGGMLRKHAAAGAAAALSSTAGACSGSNVLVTGALGQIGMELVDVLRANGDNVLATDIRRPHKSSSLGEFAYCDVTRPESLDEVIVNNDISVLVHLAGIVSGAAEANPRRAYGVNTLGQYNVISAALAPNLTVFSPSSIAAFGPTTPRDDVPNSTITEPTTNYGASKVYGESMGRWGAAKHGLDYRSLRYPGVISYKAPPGGGTTDYACAAPLAALTDGTYECYLAPETTMPFSYMPDILAGTAAFIAADRAALSTTTYNLTSCSFSAAEFMEAIKLRIPNLEVTYKPDLRQAIADSWPRSIDDSLARADWAWSPRYGLQEIVDDMLENMAKNLEGEA